MKKYKIGVWGQFGPKDKVADGQAVRTNVIYDNLHMRYGQENIQKLTTYNWKRNPFTFLFKTIHLIRTSETVVILPADNGFRVIVPLLNFINKIRNRRLNVVYIVIGGFLPDLLEDNKKYVKMINSFSAIFVQTKGIRKELEALGVRNIFLLSNLKYDEHISPSRRVDYQSELFKVCTFSRVTKDKGILDAVKAFKLFSNEVGKEKTVLHIYGIIDPNFEEEFYESIESHKNIQYKSVVSYDEAAEVISQYHVMVFPTYYYGEGFAGGILDSFFAGTPLIATDWLYNKDIITHGHNGFLVPIRSPRNIQEYLYILYQNRNLVLTISQNNFQESRNFLPEKVLRDLYEVLDEVLDNDK